MGLDVLDEFWPLTPLRTVQVQLSTTKSNLNLIINGGSQGQTQVQKMKNNNISDDDHITSSCSTDDDMVKVLHSDHRDHKQEDDDVQNCSTPKSEGSILKPSLVCPAAPRKPRPPRRKLRSNCFRVSDDLNSLYYVADDNDDDGDDLLLLQPRSKKIRAI